MLSIRSVAFLSTLLLGYGCVQGSIRVDACVGSPPPRRLKTADVVSSVVWGAPFRESPGSVGKDAARLPCLREGGTASQCPSGLSVRILPLYRRTLPPGAPQPALRPKRGRLATKRPESALVHLCRPGLSTVFHVFFFEHACRPQLKTSFVPGLA